MRNRVTRGVAETVRVPCAERADGGQLRLADGLDPTRGGWQLLFRGLGAEVRFNTLPLTFLVDGKLVAQVIAVRAEGLDWYGCLVPEPAPSTPEEADARFGVESGVGAVMRQIASSGTTVMQKPTRYGLAAMADAPLPNRAARRKHAAENRRQPSTGARPRRPV